MPRHNARLPPLLPHASDYAALQCPCPRLCQMQWAIQAIGTSSEAVRRRLGQVCGSYPGGTAVGISQEAVIGKRAPDISRRGIPAFPWKDLSMPEVVPATE